MPPARQEIEALVVAEILGVGDNRNRSADTTALGLHIVDPVPEVGPQRLDQNHVKAPPESHRDRLRLPDVMGIRSLDSPRRGSAGSTQPRQTLSRTFAGSRKAIHTAIWVRSTRRRIGSARTNGRLTSYFASFCSRAATACALVRTCQTYSQWGRRCRTPLRLP